MTVEDRQFLAFLASYITDRISTCVMKTLYDINDIKSSVGVCSYKELKEQSDILIEEFDSYD